MSARSVAARADAAAAALDAFMTGCRGVGSAHPPAALDQASLVPAAPDPVDTTAAHATEAAMPHHGRAPGEETRARGLQCSSMPPQAIDWLEHRLAVSGPAAALENFRGAAAGAGTIPWAIDFAELEEDWFHRLMAPAGRTLSAAGARTLAGQLRAAAERRHAIACARVGRSRACPFDLHALVPVPGAVLRLGPDHADAIAWLRQHWGTTELPRHVAIGTAAALGGASPAPPPELPAMHLRFWAADWSPWAALARIRRDWPALHVEMRPVYDLR